MKTRQALGTELPTQTAKIGKDRLKRAVSRESSPAPSPSIQGWRLRRDALAGLANVDVHIAVPRLIKALDDEDSHVRIEAIRLLRNYAFVSTARNALLRCLADADSIVSDVALQALKQISAAPVPNLPKLIVARDLNVRTAAIELAGHVADHSCLDALAGCLTDTRRVPSSEARICDLAQRAIALIQHNLDEARLSMNVPTIASHGQAARPYNPPAHSNESEEVRLLLPKLKEASWGTREQAVRELHRYVKQMRQSTSPVLVLHIRELAEQGDWSVRHMAAEALGWIQSEENMPTLIKLLEDTNWKVRVAALRGLAEIQHTQAAASIQHLLFDPQASVREACAETLARLGNTACTLDLVKASADPDDFVRIAVMEALAKIGGESAAGALVHGLKDTNPHVRWAAACGLKTHAHQDNVSSLVLSLTDTDGPYWEQSRICDIIADILSSLDTAEARLALEHWRGQ